MGLLAETKDFLCAVLARETIPACLKKPSATSRHESYITVYLYNLPKNKLHYAYLLASVTRRSRKLQYFGVLIVS